MIRELHAKSGIFPGKSFRATFPSYRKEYARHIRSKQEFVFLARRTITHLRHRPHVSATGSTPTPVIITVKRPTRSVTFLITRSPRLVVWSRELVTTEDIPRLTRQSAGFRFSSWSPPCYSMISRWRGHFCRVLCDKPAIAEREWDDAISRDVHLRGRNLVSCFQQNAFECVKRWMINYAEQLVFACRIRVCNRNRDRCDFTFWKIYLMCIITNPLTFCWCHALKWCNCISIIHHYTIFLILSENKLIN